MGLLGNERITVAAERLEVAALRLRNARDERTPCSPVRDLLSEGGVVDAYAVQRINADFHIAAGGRPIGWKIGLTSPAVQAQLGVDQPDFGMCFADMCVGDDQPIDVGRLLQPRVEAEVAFVLEHSLDCSSVTVADVLTATAFVVPAIEIVDSRIAGWDIDFLDTVADNASSGLFVLGGCPVPLSGIDLRAASMTLTCDGQVVSTGSGAACLGHPLNAVVWLANMLASLGQPLRAGDVVLSGALGPMHPVRAGTVYEADVSGLGSVRANFVEVSS